MAVVAGACVVYTLPELLPLAWFVPLLAVCLVRFPGRVWVVVLVATAAWTTWSAHRHMQQRLPAAQDASVRWVHGHVHGLPEAGAIRTRFAFVADAAPRRLRLSWYGDAPVLQAGDCYALKVKLSAPHGSANPGGFDYEGWLWREGIGATGYVKAARRCPGTQVSPIAAWRAEIVADIGAVLGQHPMRGIVEALTLGVTARISDAQWRVLRNTGTTHIVAISGWHIALVAGWFLFLARWLLLRLPWRLPVLAVSSLVALLGATGYALLAGLQLPTLRSVLMIGFALLALLLARRISFSRVLALAAIAVVVWHPMAVLSPGFWLSFGAVAWIIYLVQMQPRSKLALFVWLQLGIAIGLAPITLYIFNQASLVAPLVNAFVIPLAGIYVPLLLLCVVLTLAWPAVGGPCLRYCADMLGAFWPLLHAIADWPLAILTQPVAGLLAVCLALVGAVLLFMPRGLPGRWLGLVLVVPLLFGWRASGTQIPMRAYRLTVLDVGQGLAVVVRTRNHVLVYDAGPAYRTGFNAGSAIVVPYLRHMRIDRVDMLMISHADRDHMGGAAVIMQRMPVTRRVGAGSDTPCHAGQAWHWDGVDLRVLHPLVTQHDLNDNNSSCVLRISAPGGVTLLTGDIEVAAEQALVERIPRAIDADIVVVPHHGSDSSSSLAFVRTSSPQYALVSSGWHNRWGFPEAVVTARYRAQGARVLNTATSGALRALVAPHQRIQVRRWRVRHPRLWQIPDPS